MAYITDAPRNTGRTNIFEGFTDKLGAWFEKVGTARIGAQRLARMEQLNAKTDAELEAMGIRRQDIARTVCPHLLYL